MDIRLDLRRDAPPVSAGAAGRWRLASGGEIDRARVLEFSWNGRTLKGFAGDTLASALLANGERLIGRSFKFHRPRGILSAGAEEPNALVALGEGAALEPTARATLVPLRSGLAARSQNCWPSVRFDLGRVLDLCAPLWPAGFYNKMFFWPSWHTYEPLIRRTAGLGAALTDEDPERYESLNASCDLLIAGGGVAGLAAARLAARAGLRVMLAEQAHAFGGSLLARDCQIEERPGSDWVRGVIAELTAAANVTLLPSTTVFGLYDHRHAGLLERLNERVAAPVPIRQRYWRVRAASILLATGAIEQPLAFEHNDLPGIMLAGAVGEYAHRFAVACGRRVIFATNNDSAYVSALALLRAGIEVPLLIDSRSDPPPALLQPLESAGVRVRGNAVVVSATGNPALTTVRVASLGASASIEQVRCDALAMSGGWMPAVHLFSQARGQLRFDAERQCFLPVEASAPVVLAGALAGTDDVSGALTSAAQALAAEATRLGWQVPPATAIQGVRETPVRAGVGRLRRSPFGRAHRAWIDYQHDVTVADVELALREGYEPIELLKRYTTNGMAVDQGKTSNLNALLLVADLTGREPQSVGTTTFRPPYTPVTLGAIAARQIGDHYAPRRYLPAHAEHEALGARFEEAGGWMRPSWYPRAAETREDAIRREVLAVRGGVGLFDASPLGKIEIAGPDAARFLDRFYVNNVLTLEPGKARYGLMLDENGVIIDDGTIARLEAEHFVITTTSGGAGRIAAWLEEWHQCEWPDMQVLITPVTTQWSTVALSGPLARTVLARLPTDIDLGATAFPHLHVRCGTLAGVPARIFRVSFSGELGFEINVPAGFGASLWRTLLDVGRAENITPYGLEALLVLRLEKGFLHVGADTDGTTAPGDVGWGEVAQRKSADYIGRRSLARSENRRTDRLQLMGLSSEGEGPLVCGAHLRFADTTEGSDGWITSAALSPTLGRYVALAMVRGGRARIGDLVHVHDLGKRGVARIVDPRFYDPKGERLHA
jgi:sarcosine oxidase subunit alpha